MTTDIDLFGNPIEKDELLRDRFIEPPFSVLDTKSGNWQRRKRMWIAKGIQSEVGRDAKAFNMSDWLQKKPTQAKMQMNDTSIFDPALCEVLYHSFCPPGGSILDPFAGGSVRGIVANYLGYQYTGIDIRPEQIVSNQEQALAILGVDRMPEWIADDSRVALDTDAMRDRRFDMVFSCPPYADLEVYSDLEGDISNKPYHEFLPLYMDIIAKSCALLKTDGYACFVVGEVRDRNGWYLGFVPDTIKVFEQCGMRFYNEAILLNALASAGMRAGGNMKTQKLVKVHQNVLVFKKP